MRARGGSRVVFLAYPESQTFEGLRALKGLWKRLVGILIFSFPGLLMSGLRLCSRKVWALAVLCPAGKTSDLQLFFPVSLFLPVGGVLCSRAAMARTFACSPGSVTFSLTALITWPLPLFVLSTWHFQVPAFSAVLCHFEWIAVPFCCLSACFRSPAHALSENYSLGLLLVCVVGFMAYYFPPQRELLP